MLYESSYYGIVQMGDVIEHHGIKGMKWGVRRYQNPDGSLTAAGRAKYLTSDGKFNKAGQKRLAKEEKKLAKLKDRADVDLQKQKADEYDKRATKAMAVSAGMLLTAAAFNQGSSNPLDKMGSKVVIDKIKSDSRLANESSALRKITAKEALGIADKPGWRNDSSKLANYDKAVSRYEKAQSALDAQHASRTAVLEKQRKKVLNLYKARDIATYGLLGASAVSGGVAAYNYIQSKLAKQRVTDIGHAKAVAAYKAQADRVKRLRGSVRISEIRKAG